VCWIKIKVYERKLDTQNKLLAHIPDADTCIQKCEDQLRKTTRDIRKRAAKSTEVDDGTFNTAVHCNKSATSV
jgi:hypothetical protein